MNDLHLILNDFKAGKLTKKELDEKLKEQKAIDKEIKAEIKEASQSL